MTVRPGAADDALLARIVPGVGGVAWPALPGAVGSSMLALQFQLEHTQWWPAATLARHQHRQLRALLDHARRTVPFYEDRLASLDLDRGLDPLAFRALPTLTRAQVQADTDALHSRAVPPSHGSLLEAKTSGSTGEPVRIVGTQIHRFWWGACLLRDHLWHARDLGGKLAAIRTKIAGGDETGWGPATDSVFRTGPCVTLNIRADIAEQARWLAAENPDYLLSHPTNVLALARHCLAQGLRIPRLREVRTFGEALPAELRDACRQAWGVPVADCYSTNEVGYVALQCPVSGDYHVQAESVYLEVLDEAGAPCAPGTTGRVVATALHNYAMPLIRYELNDYAEVGPPCPCGRGLPVLKRILGRRRNMLRLPDGTTHWPSFPSRVWLEVAPIRQFQLVQTALDTITLRLVVDRPLDAAAEARLADELNRRFGWPFRYRYEYPGAIERTDKFEDFVSLLDAPG